MNAILNSKYFWLFIIVMGLNIPLSMIEYQIEQRSSQREVAQQLIQESWTGKQTLLTGLFVVDYEEKVLDPDRALLAEQMTQKRHAKETLVDKWIWLKRRAVLIPDSTSFDIVLENQSLNKGIFSVPVYTATIQGNIELDLTKYHSLLSNEAVRLSGQPYVSFGVSDMRGIASTPEIILAEKQRATNAGTNLNFLASGFHMSVDNNLLEENKLLLNLKLKLKGMSSLSLNASGRQNIVSFKSDWPHPNFFGAFLPTSREISEKGYRATWETGIFATNFFQKLESCLKGNCSELFSNSFGVKHIQPVDIYLQSLRSVKYGLLIIVITFTLFLLYEVVRKNNSIHPIAYALVGFALAIFFLLLIALSEHISFAIAFILASGSCSLLISFYISAQTRSRKEGGLSFVSLLCMYLILYFIIRSEDYALLSGSLILFLLLTIVFYATRNLNWYEIIGKKDNSDKQLE